MAVYQSFSYPDKPQPIDDTLHSHKMYSVKNHLSLIVSTWILLLCLASPGFATTENALTHWHPLIHRLTQDGLSVDTVEQLFIRLNTAYSPAPMAHKITAMYRRKFSPKKRHRSSRKKRPAIYPGVIEPQNLTRARHFLQQYAPSFREMEKTYGVPKEIAVGLMLVETRLGAFLGNVQAFQNLACLAATTSSKQITHHLKGLSLTGSRQHWLKDRVRKKSDWAYAELKSLIQYCGQNSLDPITMPGSIYGAVGVCQFMPSNILRFGIDGDNDGKINLFHIPDAAHSLANYLQKHGWGKNISRAGQRKVLYQYNHSTTYANTILAVADALQNE